MSSYVGVAQADREALDSVEAFLGGLPVDTELTTDSLRAAGNGRIKTDDHLFVLARALEDLGILRRSSRGWTALKSGLATSQDYRRGVRDALDGGSSLTGPTVRILVAPPPSPPHLMRGNLASYSLDLRFALFELIASARSELLLISPFWDEQTTVELRAPLQGRLDDGVKIILLARHVSDAVLKLRSALRFEEEGQFRIHTWFQRLSEVGIQGISTFHVKAIVADRGRRAYLGSANLTLASLRSRMEIGVRLDGEAARQLSTILYSSLELTTER